ncbi:MAG: DUF4105 domain-containing protein [Proteobacteria bacterium]|nr:DUF4105 domain-containing protein [Pseudomonadota bacterium]
MRLKFLAAVAACVKHMPMPHTLIAILFVLTAPAVAAAETRQDQGRFKIHVITMGQGEELFARFGHIGLMVEDQEQRTKKVYNFGTFDFSDPDLRPKYVRGFLNYWLSVGTYARTVRRYIDYDREMVVRTLNFNPQQAAEVVRRLEINALPENRYYAYRHYLDNCCTRIRDILDDVSGGLLSRDRNKDPTGRTFRDWTRKALTGLPVLSTLILFSLGSSVDQPITRYDEQFLPSVVAEDLDAVRMSSNDQPFVAQKKTVIVRRGPPVGESIPTMDLVIGAVLLGLLIVGLGLPIALAKRRIAARLTGIGLVVFGFIAGLGGLVLVLFWTVTTHYDTYYNENMLITPVFHLLLLGPGFKLIFTANLGERTGRLLGWYLIIALGVVLLDVVLKAGPFIQNNWEFVAFAAPCNAAALAALYRTGLLPRLSKSSG